MKIEMFDDKTGLPVGPIEIPDDIFSVHGTDTPPMISPVISRLYK